MEIIKLKPIKFDNHRIAERFVNNYVEKNYPEYYYDENNEWGYFASLQPKEKSIKIGRAPYDVYVLHMIFIGGILRADKIEDYGFEFDMESFVNQYDFNGVYTYYIDENGFIVTGKQIGRAHV